VGLPARLAVTVAQWELRDPRPLDELAARHLTDADWVYCDWAGYYAARAHAGEVFLYAYRTQLTPSEKADIDALLIRPEQLSEIRFWIGGEWEAVERHTPVPRVSGPLGFRAAGVAEAYELTLYRRAEPPVPSVEPR